MDDETTGKPFESREWPLFLIFSSDSTTVRQFDDIFLLIEYVDTTNHLKGEYSEDTPYRLTQGTFPDAGITALGKVTVPEALPVLVEVTPIDGFQSLDIIVI